MGGRVIALALALAVCGAAAAQQDAKNWAEANATFNKFGGSKDAAERTKAAEAIGDGRSEKYDKTAAKMIIALLGAELARDKGGVGKDEEKVSGEVLDACETALKKITHKEAVEDLINIARAKAQNPRLRFYVCRAIGVHKDAVKALIELVDDKILCVQIGAIDGLILAKDPSSLDVLLKVVSATDRTWECKIGAVQAIEKIADKSDKVVDSLIDALGKCKVDEGRIKVEIMRVLGDFLGIKDAKSDDPNWWKSAKKDKESPAKDGTTIEPAEFFGLKAKSTRIVFVLDRTGSMADPCTFPDKPKDPKKDPPKPGVQTGEKPDPAQEGARQKAEELKKKYDERKVASKMDGLKREFINTIYNLDPRVHFTVVWYEGNHTYWKEQLVPATWQTKLECIQDIDKLNPSGGTNVWGGLEAAYKLVEQPARPDVVQVDKKGNYATVVNGPDTFFLMTDGNHNTGKFVKDQGGRPGTDDGGFIGELKKVHALRKVVINVVALGDLGAGADPITQNSLNFLKKIADETGGNFAHIGK